MGGSYGGDYNVIDEGFSGYIPAFKDPGPGLLIAITIFCFGGMFVLVPFIVWFTGNCRSKGTKEYNHGIANINREGDEEGGYTNMETILEISREKVLRNGEDHGKGGYKIMDATPKKDGEIFFQGMDIVRCDRETRKILSRATPFTVASVGSAIFSNACLALVGHYIGTHALAAYAIVEILAGLTDGVLYGPLCACSTLCSHAVGAGNSFMAGQYIQLATLFYVALNIPMIIFWTFLMEKIVLYLEWGDQKTAALAQEFIQVYIYSYTLGGISSAVWQLLEVSGHAAASSLFSLAWGAVNLVVIGFMVTQFKVSLFHVGMAYNITALCFVAVTFGYAEYRGWLEPYHGGLFSTNGLKNKNAIKALRKQSVPLSFGYLLSSSEWAVLTFFAAYMGPAEVAAWAILGSIWDIIERCTSGIGDAAEIRAAYHFGCNDPNMAKLSSYKSLFLSLVMASVVSTVLFSLQNYIPAWFTVDETLQGMLLELVPYIGIANISLQFGSTSCSLLGAQGKYKLATWIEVLSSWGVTMPLAAILVLVVRLDLQGLTAAAIIGYVTTGAVISYFLLSTNWAEVARTIEEENMERTTCDEDSVGEEVYAAIRNRKGKTSMKAAMRNIKLITILPGETVGVILGNHHSLPGTYVCEFAPESSLVEFNGVPNTLLSMGGGALNIGDAVLAVNGEIVTRLDYLEVHKKLAALKAKGYTLALKPAHFDPDTYNETFSIPESSAFVKLQAAPKELDANLKQEIEKHQNTILLLEKQAAEVSIAAETIAKLTEESKVLQSSLKDLQTKYEKQAVIDTATTKALGLAKESIAFLVRVQNELASKGQATQIEMQDPVAMAADADLQANSTAEKNPSLVELPESRSQLTTAEAQKEEEASNNGDEFAGAQKKQEATNNGDVPFGG